MPRINLAQDARRLRLGAYPDRDDQLDAIWKELGAQRHAIELVASALPPATARAVLAIMNEGEGEGAAGKAMLAEIRSVKARLPKPQETK